MKYLSDEKGLTLVEVIIAMVIIAVAIVPMLSNMTSLFKTIYIGRDNMSTNYLSMQAAEKVRATDFDSIDSLSLDNPGSGYTIEKVVTLVPNSNSNLKQVTIKIMKGTIEKAKVTLICYRKGM